MTAANQVTVPGRAVAAAPASLEAVRACYGAALLLAPGLLIRICTGYPADSRVRLTAQVLGARHLLQAVLTAGAGPGSGPGAGGLAASAAVDLIHAAPMAGLAAVSRPLRRTALTDALLETALAAAGLVIARAQRAGAPAPRQAPTAHGIRSYQSP